MTPSELIDADWAPCPDQAGFIDLVGPFWQRPGDDGPRYGFVARPEHANLIGVVQGGMLMTFADRVLGLRAWSLVDGTPCVTVQFEMQFVAATRIGDLVELQPEVVHRTSSLIFLRGTLTTQGRPVAAATGIWKVLRRAAPRAAARSTE